MKFSPLCYKIVSMTLATHTIIGGIAASFFPTHPEVGFIVAFASHFAIDAIPHWDYPLRAYELDKKNNMNSDIALDKRFAKDLINIGLDVLIGLLVSSYILMFIGKFSLPILIVGALGGIIPDALQLVYMKFRHQPLISLQRFHIWIQRDERLRGKPFIGTLLQIALIVIAVSLASIF